MTLNTQPTPFDTNPKPGFIERQLISAKFTLKNSFLRRGLLSIRHRGLRDEDVFLASYPKSGNTWLRHLLTGVIRGVPTPWRGGIDTVSHLTGRHHSLPAIASGGGRLIKTHEPYRSEYKRAVLLVRDGRDVAVSEYFYQQAYSRHSFLYQNSFDIFLDRFLDGHVNSYGAWHSHVDSWLDSHRLDNFLVVRFDELKNSTFGTLRAIVDFIGVEASDEILRGAIDDCSVDSMKNKERLYWESRGQSNRGFVRAAKSGGWRQHFSLEQEEKFWSVAGNAIERLGLDRDRGFQTSSSGNGRDEKTTSAKGATCH